MSNAPKEKAKDLLLEIYGGKSFCKIYQALAIGKIKFSFAMKGKEKEGIDCYLDVDDFVANFIAKIRNRDFLRLADAEKKRAKAANEQYCKDIWKSRVGLSGENLRAFSMQPGSATELVFRATQNKTSIIVGFDYRELELLEYRWSFLEKDWNKIMEERYSLENMRDANREKYNKQQLENIEKEETQVESEPAPQPASNPAPAQSTAEKPKFMASGTTPTETEPVKEEKPSVPVLKMRLKVTVPIVETKTHNKCLKAIAEDGTEYVVFFSKELMQKCGAQWKEIENKCAVENTILTIKGQLFNGRISVVEIP